MTKTKTPRNSRRAIATLDFETDPFLYGRIPRPFVAGFRAKKRYVFFWGDDCVSKLIKFLDSLEEPHLIYAHNGGKFDIHFLFGHISNPIKVINGRIVSARIGKHELRDSWNIIPASLKAANDKDDIDYRLMERDKRQAHKRAILDYLRADCDYLFELVERFTDRYGPRLTIAGTALRELTKLYPQSPGSESHDARFRGYYFGGRVSCFEMGIVTGKLHYYDVNSMYPDVMRNCAHPKGKAYITPHLKTITRDGNVKTHPHSFYFIKFTGSNRGALPVKLKNGLSFNVPHGTFCTTSHEMRAAMELGLITVEEVHEILIPIETQSFPEFVDKYSKEKAEAKARGDKVDYTIAKIMQNGAYGKFGQDPRKYKEWQLVRGAGLPTLKDGESIGQGDAPGSWAPYEVHPEWAIWATPNPGQTYYDVAIAASVTSAARAKLLRAIHHCTRPIYCDTDSLICEGLGDGVPIHNSDLGAWKLEAIGTRAAIAGKKLYALWDGDSLIASASKGARLSGDEIETIARGGSIKWNNAAPSFSLSGNARFISRKISSTGVDKGG